MDEKDGLVFIAKTLLLTNCFLKFLQNVSVLCWVLSGL